jgi:hypothetical protein
MLNLVFGTWFGSIPAVGFAVCFAFVPIVINRCGGNLIAIKGASRSRAHLTLRALDAAPAQPSECKNQ